MKAMAACSAPDTALGNAWAESHKLAVTRVHACADHRQLQSCEGRDSLLHLKPWHQRLQLGCAGLLRTAWLDSHCHLAHGRAHQGAGRRECAITSAGQCMRWMLPLHLHTDTLPSGVWFMRGCADFYCEGAAGRIDLRVHSRMSAVKR